MGKLSCRKPWNVISNPCPNPSKLCFFIRILNSIGGVTVASSPWEQGSWDQHGAHLGPTGPRWAQCWSHELCYLGREWLAVGCNNKNKVLLNIEKASYNSWLFVGYCLSLLCVFTYIDVYFCLVVCWTYLLFLYAILWRELCLLRVVATD